MRFFLAQQNPMGFQGEPHKILILNGGEIYKPLYKCLKIRNGFAWGESYNPLFCGVLGPY